MATAPTPPTSLMAVVDSTAPLPTFEDDFSTGVLSSNWKVSNYTVLNFGGAGSDVTFSPAMIDMSQGCLCLILQQPTATTSNCAEIKLNQLFGFGTYEWEMRASSTSPTVDGPGSVVSGQDSSTWIYLPDPTTHKSITEIDAPEIQGRLPNTIEYTSWLNGVATHAKVTLANPEAGFHKYRFVWSASRIDFYIDGASVASITSGVPSQTAHPMINHWGTNSSTWGGLATVGVTRYMYVKNFKFWVA